MRRAVVTLLAAIVLSLAVAVAPAGAGDVAQQQQTESPSGAPSIIPSPNERGKNNIGGLVVGVVLLGGWSLMGYGLYRQARRRRATTDAAGAAGGSDAPVPASHDAAAL